MRLIPKDLRHIPNPVPPYRQQLAEAEAIARAEIARYGQGREEASWYGVREAFPRGLPEEVLQQAVDRVEQNIKNDELDY